MKRLDKLKLKKLRAFFELAEGRNTTTTLGLTYRTTQRYIQEIETVFGHELFDGRRVRKNLTKEGKLLHEAVKKIFIELDKLDRI